MKVASFASASTLRFAHGKPPRLACPGYPLQVLTTFSASSGFSGCGLSAAIPVHAEKNDENIN
jgi:hypothetical protein